MDYLKKSRIEEVLIAILGKGTVTSQLISRIEKILDAIRVKGSYDGIAMSEVEEILVCILLGKRFDKPTHSRIAAMLKVKANGGEYTELRKSRVEELIFEWINAVESATYSGTLPATLQTVEGHLESYKIYGNTVQDGTPTPENPIMPNGCGVRTENLFDPDSTRYHMGKAASNQIGRTSNGAMFYIRANAGRTYTIKIHTSDSTFVRLYLSDAPIVDGVVETYSAISESETVDNPEVSITNTNYAYLWVQVGGTWYTEHGGASIMLNLGSTALSYEPYGYKLPLTVNGVEHPIYLGEAETTRRIKKLVLTGEENWKTDLGRFTLTITDIRSQGLRRTEFYCSSYQVISDGREYADVPNNAIYTGGDGGFGAYIYIHTYEYTTITNFKSFLSAQYAAGTPVTVWYVLAEPETGIINEPLMKIGDYADTIDNTQSTVQIPTAAGTTIIDYGGAPKPDKVELTYSKPK